MYLMYLILKKEGAIITDKLILYRYHDHVLSYYRNDYMGRIIIPVSSIPMGTSKQWYPICGTQSAPAASGQIEISMTLKYLDDAEVITVSIFFKCSSNFQLSFSQRIMVV